VALDSNGSYAGVTFTTLKNNEGSLGDTSGITPVTAGQGVEVNNATANTYTVVSKSKSGTFFAITRDTSGNVLRCKPANSTTACGSNSGW
jgi:hypothetical protein